MLKLTKKADYGLMAMKHLAEHAHEAACSAKDVAEAYGIPQEALAKILQRLAKAGLLRSQHGINGGYTRARGPKTNFAFLEIPADDGAPFFFLWRLVGGGGEPTQPLSLISPPR